jgi:hypothetical protein
VNDFVEECRREWRRLGVADPIADEMAADLTADLDEAAAEGGSPEDVLGTSAFDPRPFAASWAAARGVTGAGAPERHPWLRTPVRVAGVALLGAFVVLAGLALLVGSGRASVAVVSRRILVGPGPIHVIPGGPKRLALPGVGRTFGASLPLLAMFVLVLVGISGLALFAVVWARRTGSRRFGRDKGGRTPSWN